MKYLAQWKLPEWWQLEENLRVVKLLQDIGVGTLGNFDGCVCCHFKIRNVEIEISCGKGNDRGLWISSPSFDYYDRTTENGNNEKLLRPIAEEIVKQVQQDGRGQVPIHYHEWRKE